MVKAFEFHVIGELLDVEPEMLDDVEFVQSALVEAVLRSGLTLFDVLSQRRPEGGVLSIAIIGESHAAVHTWPDRGLVTVAISSCKDAESTWQVFIELKRIFRAKRHKAIEMRSGIPLMERIEGLPVEALA